MLELIVLVVLLISTYLIGTAIEKEHLRALHQREHAAQYQPFLSEPFRQCDAPVAAAFLVRAQVVISGDLFRHFWAGLSKVFGGDMAAYEGLKNRAQREAVLRIKEQHPQAACFVNAKIETVNKRLAMAKVIVYATVIYLDPHDCP